MKFSFAVLSLVSTAIAAYIPSEAWDTLTPTGAVTISCAETAYTQSFGIAIGTITTPVNVKQKRDLATQVEDGQIQATITPSVSSYSLSFTSVTATAASHPDVIITQIHDGQIQAPAQDNTISTMTPTSSFEYRSISTKSEPSSSASHAPSTCATDAPIAKQATCKTDNDLAITLVDGVLKDSHDRIGSIVSNRQFQFDGPTPQAGAIYAAGWSIVDGHLALGNDDVFWECLSGDFYNLYDESIGEQCTPIYLNVIDLVDC